MEKDIMLFRRDFADAYLEDKVNPIGVHGTKGHYWEDKLRNGMKHFPKKYPVMRMELGVHYDQIIPIKKTEKLTKIIIRNRRDVLRFFDSLTLSKGNCYSDTNPDLKELPGVVLLKERIPRARFYSYFFEEGEGIYRHKYVPMIKGLENTTHTLISKEYILDVIFLSKKEARNIVKEANKKYGSLAFLINSYEGGKTSKGEIIGKGIERDKLINKETGRLLLYKSRKYLIKE